jgi:hypothetical protein
MVREDNEVARFQCVTQIFHSLVGSEEFAVVGAVFLLRRVELFGKECERLPGAVNTLLQDGTHSSCGGVCYECKLRGWIGVRQ